MACVDSDSWSIDGSRVGRGIKSSPSSPKLRSKRSDPKSKSRVRSPRSSDGSQGG